MTMTEKEGLAYLTRCSDGNGIHWSGGVNWSAEDCPTCRGTDEAGHLGAPGSRYGRTAAECAPIAWRVAEIIRDANDEETTEDGLDHLMGLVVNDSDGPAELLAEYGTDDERAEWGEYATEVG